MITSLQDAETPPARTIVRELRRLRRGHSDRSVWQALEQGYLWAFGLLMVGSISGAALARVWSELGRCTSGGCAGDPTTLVALLGVAGFVLVVRGLSSFGPVVASRATATWLLSSPVDRGGLLRGRVYGILGTAAVVGGGVLGSVAALMVLGTDPRSAAGAGIGPGSAIGLGSAVGLGAVAGAGIGALLAAVAVLLQQRPGGRRVVIGSCDVLLVGLLALTPWASAVVVPLPTPIGLAGTAVIALGAAVVVAIGAVGGLSRLPRRDLLAGSELLAGLSGAAASMDTSLVSDLLVHRRFRRLGRARSRRGRWTGPMAIPVREAWRVLRSPGRLVLAVGLLAVPYAVATLGVASAVPAAAVAAGYVALRPWGGGLHAVSRSLGFRRAFPLGDRGLRLLLATPLLAVAVVWSLLVAPATALGWAGGLAVAATVAAGVVRSSTRPPVTYDGPLMSTPAGAIPMGFVTQVFRGPDVALVGVLPMVLGLPTPLTVVLPIVVLGYVLGTGRL